jgi:hypothetical protein
MLAESTLPALSNVYPDFVTFVTVRVYVPRAPDVLSLTVPELPVVPLTVLVVLLGRVHFASTFAPDTAFPLASLT